MAGFRNPNLGLIAGVSSAAEGSGEDWKRNLGQSRLHLGQPRHTSWWTGLPPQSCPGYNTRDARLYSLTIPDLNRCSRGEALAYFNNTWTLTELLFSSLIGDEPFYRPPYHGLRHPLIFYYVHPAVLYVNKLRLAGLRTSPVNSYFESLFETGVDEMSWDDMSKNVIEWPGVDEALHYRRQVYDAVVAVIESDPGLNDGHPPILQDHPLWALFMSFEHERIHLETSSVLIRELPVHLVSRPAEWPAHAPLSNVTELFPVPGLTHPHNSMVNVPATVVELGKPLDWPTFGWDNEYGHRSCRVNQFDASQVLVSNGEFWQFVAEGGYHEKEYWSEVGWRWRSFRNVKWPTFWVPDGPAGGNQYRLRACFEIVPMQWEWPAVVNYHEARAFCAWKSRKEQLEYRLTTEAEHQALRQMCGFSNADRDALLPPPPFNSNLRYGSETAVGATVSGAAFGDLFGNVWQWCEDHFNPLDGARIHRYYDDFSTPCYDGQHQMILGGSFMSTGDEASSWARYHFRPHFFQHAGFRVVQSQSGSDGCAARIGESAATVSPYETEDVFNEYMTLHFGAPALQMPFSFGPVDACSFPQRCAELVLDWCEKLRLSTNRALDVGCAVGGASFKLAEKFDHVTGVDLSERFIRAAKTLQQEHQLEYRCKIEAQIYSAEKATVSSEVANRVEFRQADACSLPPEFLEFDAVLMANLLCRLPSPGACLGRMAGTRGIVKPGGLLITVSPYTWMERFTPKDVWLGGFIDESGSDCFSQDGLKDMLKEHFELLHCQDVPLVIREHRRKFQYIVSHAMIWRRTSE